MAPARQKITGPATTARLFRNGRSQAVRLPQEFRFEGTEVSVRRDGEAVILEPIKRGQWPRGYWARLEEARFDFEVEPLKVSLTELDLDE